MFWSALFNDLAAEDPGFITAADEGLQVNSGDSISVLFLDAAANSAAGQGFVSFYNPVTGQLEAAGNIAISNQGDASTTVLNGTAIDSGSASLFLSNGSDGNLASNAPDPADNLILPAGEIHNHLTFDIDDSTAATGAFGILLQFEADLASTGLDGVTDVTSEPFFLIFNNGLSEEVFENEAVAAFSVVPEPSAAIVLSVIAGGMLSRRRRRN